MTRAPAVRTGLKDNRGLLLFVLGMGIFRLAVADWNPIPSGSMRPTLLEGDVVLVDRLAYDLKLPLTDIALARLGEPQRGDIVTFAAPADGTRLIKRVVALPGDVVALRDDVLVVNGETARYDGFTALTEPVPGGPPMPAARAIESLAGSRRSVQFLAGVDTLSSFGPLMVPPGHYLMLGDNRDNSADSRSIGFVARQQLIGRAHHVLVSADITGHWAPRFERWMSRLQ